MKLAIMAAMVALVAYCTFAIAPPVKEVTVEVAKDPDKENR